MKRTSRRREGFTLMEVMIAVGLMTVGALAIMAMQQASTRGNIEARQISTATEITSRWVERLRRESLRWTQIGTSAVALGSPLLAELGSAGSTTGWMAPTALGDLGPGFDWTGRPMTTLPATGPVPYCTFIRLSWVRQGSLMRADVLTWWHRRGAGGDANISNQTLFPACGAANPGAVIANLDSAATVLKSVRGSTLLRWTPR